MTTRHAGHARAGYSLLEMLVVIACMSTILGLGIVTGRAEPADVPGRFGWDGAFGTSFWMDPKEGVVGVLMTQRRPDRLALPPVVLDFWNSVYQLIDE